MVFGGRRDYLQEKEIRLQEEDMEILDKKKGESGRNSNEGQRNFEKRSQGRRKQGSLILEGGRKSARSRGEKGPLGGNRENHISQENNTGIRRWRGGERITLGGKEKERLRIEDRTACPTAKKGEKKKEECIRLKESGRRPN